MLTIGVDLSAQPAKTVAAVISWDQSGATVTGLHPGATDASIVDLAPTASKVGVGCPLGWPRDFVDFVARHQRGEIRAGEGEDIAAREQLAYRRTDLAVRSAGGPNPLSVSTDRIGRAAMRAAGLLAALGVGVGADDRSGAGRLLEVYPAAALKCWGFDPRGYKGNAKQASLRRLAAEFFDRADWLNVDPDVRSQCMTSDDAFDAVVAAVNARAAMKDGWVSRPSEEDREAARTEGWIAVPLCSLSDLDPRP